MNCRLKFKINVNCKSSLKCIRLGKSRGFYGYVFASAEGFVSD